MKSPASAGDFLFSAGLSLNLLSKNGITKKGYFK